MVAIGQQSLDSSSNLFVGFWSHGHIVEDPLGTAGGPTEYYLGIIKEGVLEISREDSEYLGTTFPQRIELIVPQRSGMKFSGRLDELHKRNLHLLNGALPSETNNYIYPGTACAFESSFVRLVVRRRRCDGFVMEALIWKVLASGLIQIGGEADVIGTNFELVGIDDVNGDFGGDDISPLGYIYAPDPA